MISSSQGFYKKTWCTQRNHHTAEAERLHLGCRSRVAHPSHGMPDICHHDDKVYCAIAPYGSAFVLACYMHWSGGRSALAAGSTHHVFGSVDFASCCAGQTLLQNDNLRRCAGPAGPPAGRAGPIERRGRRSFGPGTPRWGLNVDQRVRLIATPCRQHRPTGPAFSMCPSACSCADI